MLIRLNVNDFSDKGSVLDRLDVVIKRNTIEVKRFLIKCKYLEPMLYDMIYDYAIEQEDGTLVVPLPEEIKANYTNITFLDKHITYKIKNQ